MQSKNVLQFFYQKFLPLQTDHVLLRDPKSMGNDASVSVLFKNLLFNPIRNFVFTERDCDPNTFRDRIFIENFVK